MEVCLHPTLFTESLENSFCRQIVAPRTALLSNYEVLTLLKELESEQLARQKTAIRIKKEEEERLASGMTDTNTSSLANAFVQEEVSENLRTVEVEAIQYLTADFQPTNSQSPESITQLVRGLNQFDLTKAEKLQIVNLAPTEPVELYVIVEEIEDRFGDSMEDVLQVVRSSLEKPLFLSADDNEDPPSNLQNGAERDVYKERRGWEEGGELEEEFDDFGAGAGVEGDLEMGDDNDD
ncbi:uncharacterized protein FOMMEDRAFT_96793 [Fomitiporia mediterranea MF3/22]|uniref:uncharacterized protein n=1 Tax=Fomitiporia mediterranea (strain MF3/22) TaxID=694068 RepID=UPI0004408788|nr:uncharacterized protein FOMMEDRAFT_96793 [Fomitiporia mediterranea MF3/22]EJC98412.1 hypothetical protein FOMMEDRAFT_96793 [Fomitiporia mediterranea MF3/22]